MNGRKDPAGCPQAQGALKQPPASGAASTVIRKDKTLSRTPAELNAALQEPG